MQSTGVLFTVFYMPYVFYISFYFKVTRQINASCLTMRRLASTVNLQRPVSYSCFDVNILTNSNTALNGN